jgi:hypothetical protein
VTAAAGLPLNQTYAKQPNTAPLPPPPLQPATITPPATAPTPVAHATTPAPANPVLPAAVPAVPTVAPAVSAAPASETAETAIDPNNQAILRINNINNLDQYAEVVKYLRAIPGVSKVELLNISLSTIKLKISINGGRNALANGLSSQQKLTPDDYGAKNSSENDSTLNYNWKP